MSARRANRSGRTNSRTEVTLMRKDGTRAKIDAIMAGARQHVIDDLEHSFRLAEERCESPIEHLFATAMLDPRVAAEYDTHVEMLFPASGKSEHCHAPPIPGVYMWQQIAVGPYRIDFLFDYDPGRNLPPLIVECDGHDFHEKTKEQAQRDKARDRFLVGRGYRVLRFTGSEIYRDAADVAHQTLQILLGIAD
ncbi:DUF559 domain-containing protein [Sphingomonas sp. NY01]|uniref:endonuclease domain-containing protein n=1 Tax=Sphingomonas sp. NY01 TaxID=2968057 RepID=UPI00315D897F